MRKAAVRSRNFSFTLIATILAAVACSPGADAPRQAADTPDQPRQRYVVVEPGTHPSLLFAEAELEELRRKAQGTGLPREMWDKIKRLSDDWDMRGEWTGRGMAMNAKALIYLVEGNEAAGREALAEMKAVLEEIEPHEYYREEVGNSFFHTEYWPKELAFGYDWLYPLMTERERDEIVDKLEVWCEALYQHTEDHWWRAATINCGAIPVGALGLLCVAIQDRADHPQFDTWLESCVRRIRDNYYPFSWRENGICTEGPCYAHYHKNGTMFGEALRRNGGPDIVTGSGAINAMHYQRFQWMPHGGEGPIGDNTNYGRRMFQSIYLLGIGEMRDRAGLYTFEKWTDRERMNPILAFIFHPSDLEPVSAGTQDLYTSYYFEITPNRAGYLYSRSAWDDEQAAYFAFVTRDRNVNHQHYDMNTFLFNAFGEEFATHANLWGYSDSLHGVDKEHNIVIVDGGGMPGHDAINGAGDDCSVNGLMTGVGTGHFGDYVRGDARLSYEDISLEGSTPAVRADRYGAFVKQGPNPYVIVIDDIRKSEDGTHDYDWLWYSDALELAGGSGALDDPLVIPGDNASCAVAFVTPEEPDHSFEVVTGEKRRRNPKQLGLTSVRQTGNRVQYFAVGAAWKKGSPQPSFEAGPAADGSRSARSLIVRGEGFTDYIFWQPEEVHGEPGLELTCGQIVTDAFLAVVRTDEAGEVTGYLLGDGSRLVFGGKVLAQGDDVWTVSADSKRLFAAGKRHAREDRPPLPARGEAWLPGNDTEVRVDGVVVQPEIGPAGMARIGF